MTDTLTLPGSIPNLLRRGSPVLAVWGEESIDDGEYSASGVVLRIDPPTSSQGIEIAHCGWDDGDTDPTCAADTLHLDLCDATGRAHAAWWLCQRWGADALYSPLQLISFCDVDGDGFDCGEESIVMLLCGMQDVAPAAIMDDLLELLEDLDPNDPRTLPDGSRRVDAEALRRVVLHVAGLST